jgi:hypothetical protein
MYLRHDTNIGLISVFSICRHETKYYSNNGKTSFLWLKEIYGYSHLILLSWRIMLITLFFTSSFTALHPRVYGVLDYHH